MLGGSSLIFIFLGRKALRYRTEKAYRVVQYLFFVALSNKKRKERTLMEISRATGLCHETVRCIVLRLNENDCVNLFRYKYEFSEINSFYPHAIVSIEDKSHQREIIKKLRWFRDKR